VESIGMILVIQAIVMSYWTLVCLGGFIICGAVLIFCIILKII